MLSIYRILINLILIISPLIIFFRLLKKKEDPKRFKEKFCFFSKKRSKGKLVWFHGASVGEIRSVIPLIEKMEKNNKINQILITSNTLSSSKIISKLKLKKTIHQFFPLDTNHHSQKFLDFWKPSIAIFIDSEIWPNMINNVKKNNISLILLNARITKKSYKRWKKISFTNLNVFRKFDFCFTSNIESKKYLKELGSRKIMHIGNLKFSQSEKDESYLNNHLKKKFLTKKIWCAASTHNSEEKICALAHKKLKTKYKELLTIIIPRHTNRVQKIINEIKALNLKIHIHGSKKKIDKDTDIYLVNSYGETRSFFKICRTVFIGGSIIKHGGQNPLEAAQYGCNILHGPNIWNFSEIYSLLNKHGVSNKVYDSKQIAQKIEKTFNYMKNSNLTKSKIKKLGNKILNQTVNEINFFINRNE